MGMPALDRRIVFCVQAQANAAGATKSIETLGSDQKNKEIAVLVRGQLCTALSRVLLHGFKSFVCRFVARTRLRCHDLSLTRLRPAAEQKLIGRYHIWDFVQQSCDATHERRQGRAPQPPRSSLVLCACST